MPRCLDSASRTYTYRSSGFKPRKPEVSGKPQETSGFNSSPPPPPQGYLHLCRAATATDANVASAANAAATNVATANVAVATCALPLTLMHLQSPAVLAIAVVSSLPSLWSLDPRCLADSLSPAAFLPSSKSKRRYLRRNRTWSAPDLVFSGSSRNGIRERHS